MRCMVYRCGRAAQFTVRHGKYEFGRCQEHALQETADVKRLPCDKCGNGARLRTGQRCLICGRQ